MIFYRIAIVCATVVSVSGTAVADELHGKRVPTGTWDEVAVSVERCADVDDILTNLFRPKVSETYIPLLADQNRLINADINADFADFYQRFYQKLKRVIFWGVPATCLYTLRFAPPKSDEVPLLLIRTGTSDLILLDNSEPVEGSVYTWEEVVDHGLESEYSFVEDYAGREWDISPQ